LFQPQTRSIKEKQTKDSMHIFDSVINTPRHSDRFSNPPFQAYNNLTPYSREIRRTDDDEE